MGGETNKGGGMKEEKQDVEKKVEEILHEAYQAIDGEAKAQLMEIYDQLKKEKGCKQ